MAHLPYLERTPLAAFVPVHPSHTIARSSRARDPPCRIWPRCLLHVCRGMTCTAPCSQLRPVASARPGPERTRGLSEVLTLSGPPDLMRRHHPDQGSDPDHDSNCEANTARLTHPTVTMTLLQVDRMSKEEIPLFSTLHSCLAGIPTLTENLLSTV